VLVHVIPGDNLSVNDAGVSRHALVYDPADDLTVFVSVRVAPPREDVHISAYLVQQHALAIQLHLLCTRIAATSVTVRAVGMYWVYCEQLLS
jgi:hypothetical protein